MSENIECSMAVDTVTTKDSGDKSGITVVLKGQKTIMHDTGNGYEMEDTAEITLTVKFGAMITARKLGIEKYDDAKVITLRDRDESLFSEESIVPAAVQKSIV